MLMFPGLIINAQMGDKSLKGVMSFQNIFKGSWKRTALEHVDCLFGLRA